MVNGLWLEDSEWVCGFLLLAYSPNKTDFFTISVPRGMFSYSINVVLFVVFISICSYLLLFCTLPRNSHMRAEFALSPGLDCS